GFHVEGGPDGFGEGRFPIERHDRFLGRLLVRARFGQRSVVSGRPGVGPRARQPENGNEHAAREQSLEFGEEHGLEDSLSEGQRGGTAGADASGYAERVLEQRSRDSGERPCRRQGEGSGGADKATLAQAGSQLLARGGQALEQGTRGDG